MTILVIEDEHKTADTLKKGLEDSGYAVDVAYDGASGLDLLQTGNHKLIITDIIMPVMNGLDLCRTIRLNQPNIPILMLTALDSPENAVAGLDAGADDYLAKPFDFKELLARVKNLTKRLDLSDTLRFSDLELNLTTKQVSRAGKVVELTAQEFKLLVYFMHKPNTVVSREELARDVWHIDFETGTNIVEVYINYLRNKIDKPFGKKLIHNMHGVGYLLKEK